MRLKDISELNPAYKGEPVAQDVSFVPMESLRYDSLDLQSIKFEEAKGKYTFFANGDLLVAKVTPCFENGNIAIADKLQNGIGFGSSEIFVLRFGKDVSNRYMFYALQSRDFMDSACATMCGVGGLKRISPLFFRTYDMDVPSLSEQERIVAYLDEKTAAIDRKIELLEKQLDAYTRLKSSIINHAVTRGLEPNVPLRNSDSTWLGQIPEHWKEKRFCDLFTFHKGLSITKADLVDDGVAVISYGQIHAKDNPKTSLPKHLMRYVAQDYLETDSQSLLAKYDFVFADTSEDVEGSGNFAFNDYDGQIFAGYHTLTATGAKLKCPKYFAYLIQTVDWKRQIQSKVAGIKVFSIGRRILRTTTLLIPPLSEQQAIADYLDAECAKIDARKENISKRIDAYRRLKRALINETVTGQRAINAN